MRRESGGSSSTLRARKNTSGASRNRRNRNDWDHEEGAYTKRMSDKKETKRAVHAVKSVRDITW